MTGTASRSVCAGRGAWIRIWAPLPAPGPGACVALPRTSTEPSGSLVPASAVPFPSGPAPAPVARQRAAARLGASLTRARYGQPHAPGQPVPAQGASLLRPAGGRARPRPWRPHASDCADAPQQPSLSSAPSAGRASIQQPWPVASPCTPQRALASLSCGATSPPPVLTQPSKLHSRRLAPSGHPSAIPRPAERKSLRSPTVV